MCFGNDKYIKTVEKSIKDYEKIVNKTSDMNELGMKQLSIF